MMNYLVIFIAALLVALLLTPWTQRLSHQLGIVARPDARRHHVGTIPRLGGVPIMGGLLAAWGLIYTFLPPAPDSRTA